MALDFSSTRACCYCTALTRCDDRGRRLQVTSAFCGAVAVLEAAHISPLALQ